MRTSAKNQMYVTNEGTHPLRGVPVFAFFALVAFFASFASVSFALFDDLGMGARAPGMGNAFTAVADDLYAIYYNPAGLATLERSQLSASHALLHMGLSDGSNLGLSHLAFAKPLKLRKWGVLGAAWQRFALSGVYSEQSLQISYGNSRLSEKKLKWGLDKLKWGISLKYLVHSFDQLPSATNAMNDQYKFEGEVDPVLTGNTSKSAMDADIGFLYQFTNRYSVGLAVKNILQPNMAFADGAEDKVPMRTRLGFSYKSLWMILASELRMERGPSGEMDKDIIVAAERIFPSLDKGQVGLRGSIGVGSRDFKQVTAGFSYRINKLQFDYAFIFPLGTIKETAGTHRLAMLFHFGAPTAEEQYSMELLDQYKRLASRERIEELARPTSIADPRLAPVLAKLRVGKYREAARLLSQTAKDLLPDSSIISLSKRIGMVAAFYPEVPKPVSKWELLLSSGIKNFIDGKDAKATMQISYARSLTPADTKLARFMSRMEENTHLQAERVPPNMDKNLVEYKFMESETAFNQDNHALALKKLHEILELEPDDMLALKRIGSSYYAMGDYRNALKTWEKALKREMHPEEITILSRFTNAARRKLSLPVKERRAEVEKKRATDFRKIEKLYQQGVEYYAKGARLKAASIFRRILILDPGNAQALKALERIKKKTQ